MLVNFNPLKHQIGKDTKFVIDFSEHEYELIAVDFFNNLATFGVHITPDKRGSIQLPFMLLKVEESNIVM